jgi:Alr-MurF fusion protein
LNFEQIRNLTEGAILNQVDNPEITDLVTDSRSITASGEDSVFIAIEGKNHDGHEFVNELYNKGIRSFIIEKDIDPKLALDANICLVESSIIAIQKIASFQRSNFKIPMIGITGSNGKTIVKEWLAQFLSINYFIVKSPKSYNSQLGVPLSVWQTNSKHTLGIFEAGISTVNEMERLQSIIDPTIGIFTNLGSAHEKGFDSLEQKIQEKLKLFSNCNTIIYCKDHLLLDNEILKEDRFKSRTFTWSFNENSDIKIKPIGLHDFELKYEDQVLRLQLPFQDKASIENLFHCIACLLLLKINHKQIQTTLNQLKPVKMRLELKKGINQCYIIDDSYNNDLGGLKIALQFLKHQKQRGKKTLILSDILQSSLNKEALYKEVNDLVNNSDVDRLIGIGPDISSQKASFKINRQFFPSTKNFLEKFKNQDFSQEVILVKGARVYEFEGIVAALVEKLHETILEIDLDAITHNLNLYRDRLKPSCKLMVMVKALAYGSGSAEISNLLQYHKVDYLAVAYTDEGIELRNNGIELPIMVMSPKNDLEQLINYQLEPEVFDIDQLKNLVDDLEVKNKELSIHVNLNTGMNRMGFEPEEIIELTQILLNSKSIKVKSVFTHLAGADSSDHEEFSLAQLANFEKLSVALESNLNYSIIKHALNSAGIINFPNYHMDMVRLGIGLHGFDPSNSLSNELDNVSTLKSIISQIRNVKKGDTVGYSRKGIVKKDSKIATIALGYADGFSRAFSNGVGKVMIDGSPAQVVGNVCMDMTMVDVTSLNVKTGDEVIVFGRELPIEEVAKSINTIPYEILTNVSERVKRVYFSS